jgi:hypothetical protein
VIVRAVASPSGGTVKGRYPVTVGAMYVKNGAAPDDTRLDTVTSTASDAPVCCGSVHVTRVSDAHTADPHTRPPSFTDTELEKGPKLDPLIVNVLA